MGKPSNGWAKVRESVSTRDQIEKIPTFKNNIESCVYIRKGEKPEHFTTIERAEAIHAFHQRSMKPNPKKKHTHTQTSRNPMNISPQSFKPISRNEWKINNQNQNGPKMLPFLEYQKQKINPNKSHSTIPH